MIAKNLNDLRVYKKAPKAADAVSALLKGPAFRKNLELTSQLSESSSRVAPLIAEGYGQLTDRHVAVYLGRARGSVLETIGHLEKSTSEGFISKAEVAPIADMYDHIGRMLSKWIHHLQRCNWKRRG
jgi:four helix bundle protein